jgi:hypothetical protein
VFRLSTKVQSHHPVNINPTFKVCGTVFLPNLNKNYDVSDRIFNDVSDRTPKRLVHCSRDSPDPWIQVRFVICLLASFLQGLHPNTARFIFKLP